MTEFVKRNISAKASFGMQFVFIFLSSLSLADWLTIISIISAIVLGLMGAWKMLIQIQTASHEREKAKLEFEYRKEQLEMEWWEKQEKAKKIKAA
jgi:hypothetical protein